MGIAVLAPVAARSLRHPWTPQQKSPSFLCDGALFALEPGLHGATAGAGRLASDAHFQRCRVTLPVRCLFRSKPHIFVFLTHEGSFMPEFAGTVSVLCMEQLSL